MAKSIKTQGRTLFKRTTIAACVMAATAAHVQAQEAASDDPALLEEVVVYGIKQSIQNAQDIKREASTVKDVITASDIGALPDKSVVEALQRVPGVAIERFSASNDPDHFAVEGGNVTVRGLNRTRAEINGRDAFSATGNGGLNFSDIPPQMVGAVEVVKSQSASMTEGGISGNINLVTRKPLDKEELILGFTAKASYADLADEITPELSALVSNTWESDAGTFGALASITTSTFKSQSNGVGVYNFKPVNTLESNPEGYNLYAPFSGSARTQDNDRDRLGIAGSLQWASPSDDMRATLEFIRSDSTLLWSERFIEYPAQPFAGETTPAPGTGIVQNLNISDATYDCPSPYSITRQPCAFTSGLIIGAGTADNPFSGDPFYATGTRWREEDSVVNDISFNLEYGISDNLTITGDVQYISSTNEIRDTQALARMAGTNTYLDLRGTDEVKFEILDKEEINRPTSSPDSYFLRSAMDFGQDNEAEEVAFQLDGEYTFDEGLITAIKSGVRISNRTLDFQESEYNWGSLGETWMTNDNPDNGRIEELVYGSELVDRGLLEAYTFENHLNGHSLTVNDTFYVPSLDALANAADFYDRANWNGDEGSDAAMGGGSWRPLSRRDGTNGSRFLPSEMGSVEEDRTSFYVQLDFGNEDADMPFSGDVGLRYVDWQLTSTGANYFGPKSAAGSLFEGELDQYLNPASNGWNQYGLGDADWMHPDSYRDFYLDVAYQFYLQQEIDAEAADPAAAAQARFDADQDLFEADIAAHFDSIEAIKDEASQFLNRESGGVQTVKGDNFTRVLPSFNFKLGVTDDFIVRFAASESIFLPTLDRVRNSSRVTTSISTLRAINPEAGEVGANGEIIPEGKYRSPTRIFDATLDGYKAGGGGNPYLQPELSTNLDLTFEWYFDDAGSLTTSIFRKRIRDYFRQSAVINNFTNSDGVTRAVAVTRTENAGIAKVEGFEVAFQTDFGIFGDSFENFGIQTSYTFIDGSSEDYGVTEYGNTPGDSYALEYTYNRIRDLPLEGLSQDNYNFVAYYDNGTFQTRFAYNWRSKYLLNSRDVIAVAPVYGEATGQLDWSMGYQINDMFKVGLEANNLLNEVTKTSISNELNPDSSVYNQEVLQSPRSYFVNDRRFAVFVQAQF